MWGILFIDLQHKQWSAVCQTKLGSQAEKVKEVYETQKTDSNQVNSQGSLDYHLEIAYLEYLGPEGGILYHILTCSTEDKIESSR